MRKNVLGTSSTAPARVLPRRGARDDFNTDRHPPSPFPSRSRGPRGKHGRLNVDLFKFKLNFYLCTRATATSSRDDIRLSARVTARPVHRRVIRRAHANILCYTYPSGRGKNNDIRARRRHLPFGRIRRADAAEPDSEICREYHHFATFKTASS